MSHFIKKSAYFVFFFGVICELIIRFFHLVPDIPERYFDKHGIQRYKQGQMGFFTEGKVKWEVNNFGWLGVSDLEKDTIISIIGDSYIENIMNPIECNQGSFLKSLFPNYSFFEAGRSGVTFIEAMEISKVLETEIAPNYHLLYLSENDFYESISEIARYSDRVQISIENEVILDSQLKSPRMKKVLYNFKLLYYLYLKFPLFVEKQNKEQFKKNVIKIDNFDKVLFEKLFIYCSKNYNLDKLVFVLHPNTDKRIISLVNNYGIRIVLLNSGGDKNWGLGKHDNHWTCYGHRQVSKQVATYIENH